jgi:hypothetical protein
MDFTVTFDRKTGAKRALRTLQVVNISIVSQNGESILIEKQRTLPNGLVKKRGKQPSRTMNTDQRALPARKGVESVALMCLSEDLLIPEKFMTLDWNSFSTEKSTRQSNAYPGLDTKYCIHSIEVKLDYTLLKEASAASLSKSVTAQQLQVMKSLSFGTPFETEVTTVKLLF